MKFEVGDFVKIIHSDIYGTIVSHEYNVWGNEICYNVNREYCGFQVIQSQFYIRESQLRLSDRKEMLEKIELKRLKREQLKLKYIHIDPYGEEDWDE